ncbi:MAG: hypothetical protein GEV11_26445 [Streptosporangiales bacterium]|nr:hypothetical protein [Streptosporangiales bacterium]
MPAADAARLESALMALRRQIHALGFAEELPRAEEAVTARQELLDTLDDYVLPRVRRGNAPLLIAVAGSTGAGKSTMVNTLVGAQVTTTGVRRPTTNSPVLACHPGDIDWFAEDKFLPSLPRVRQQGLAMPGKDGLLVLAADERIPQGVALLDTPDIDSVVESHHEFACKFLDAADLWLFVTTASRYADARVWEFLQLARERDTAMAVVLSRVREEGREELVEHFGTMLDANGLEEAERFVILETDKIESGRFAHEIVADIAGYVERLGEDDELRGEAVRRTFVGVLDSFRIRLPELAKHVEEQVATRGDLADQVTAAYDAALAEIDESTRNGSLLRGEVLARWQDLAGSGELMRALPATRKRGLRRMAGDPRTPAKLKALEAAMRDSLEKLVIAAADRAAEDVLARWRDRVGDGLRVEDPGLASATPELGRHAGRSISAWQDHVVELVASEGVTKRSVARLVSFDEESLALVFVVGLLGFGAGDVDVASGNSAVPQRLLKALFGAESLRHVGAKARADLRGRIAALFDEEAARFTQVLDAAGMPDEDAPVHLYQATYSLEVAR